MVIGWQGAYLETMSGRWMADGVVTQMRGVGDELVEQVIL